LGPRRVGRSASPTRVGSGKGRDIKSRPFFVPLCTRVRRETVWKFLRTGQPPHHKPRHRRVDERFPCGAQPLVVLLAILRLWLIQAKVRSTTHLRGRTRKPRGGISLCQSTSSPSLAHSLEPTALCHLLGERLLGLAHHLHAQAHLLLCPTPAPSLVSGLAPQVRKAPKASAHWLQKQPDAVLVWYPGAVNPRLEH
jgi:hypothetical protein